MIQQEWDYPPNYTPIAVTILDTKTGETHEEPPSFFTWWWGEGNGACDCNRHFNSDEYPNGVGYCRGHNRYLIIAVNPLIPGVTLEYFNQDYPRELVEKFLPKEGDSHERPEG